MISRALKSVGYILLSPLRWVVEWFLRREIERLTRENAEWKKMSENLPPEEKAELDAEIAALRREFREKHGFNPP